MVNPVMNVANDVVKRAVGEAYEAMVSGRREGLGPLFADDVEFWIRGEPENLPFAGTWTGARSVAKFVELYSANVGRPGFRPRYSMLQKDGEGTALMLFVLEEGIAVPTGKAFSSESVHEWRLDRAGRIKRFASWNNSFDFYQAFAREPVDPSYVYRHPLEEALVTPTRPCSADPGVAAELFYKHLLSRDVSGFGTLMAPNAVSTLEGVEGIVPFSGTYRGIDRVKSQVATFNQVARAEVANVVPRYVVDGNRICTRFDEDGTYVFSTKYPIYFTNLHCFTVNDAGQIETFRSYNDTWRVWVAFTGGKWRPARTSM